MANDVAELKGSESVKFERFLKYLRRAASVARFAARLMLVVSFICLGIGGVGAYMLFDWGVWNWILVSIFSFLPCLAFVVFWYAFSSVADVPDVAISIKGRVLQKYPQYFKEMVSSEKRGKLRRVWASLKMCWGVIEAIGEVEDAAFAGMVISGLASSLGWVILLVATGWAALGAIVIICCSLMSYLF